MWDSSARAARPRGTRARGSGTAPRLEAVAGRRARRAPAAAAGCPGAADGPAALPRCRHRQPTSLQRRRSPVPDVSILDPVKGFGVTFATMFKKVDDRAVPGGQEADRAALPRPPPAQPPPRRAGEVRRLRAVRLGLPGRRDLRRGRDNTEEERFSPGERYGAVYQINYLRCIFCGLCIEACPTRALTMTNEYELADDSREDLIFTKEQLLAPLLPGHGAAAAPDAARRRREGLLPPRRGRRGPVPPGAGMPGPSGPTGRPVSPAPRTPPRPGAAEVRRPRRHGRERAMSHVLRPSRTRHNADRREADHLLDPRAARGRRRAGHGAASARPCTARCGWRW